MVGCLDKEKEAQMNTMKQTVSGKNIPITELSYAQVIEFLDKNWTTSRDGKSVERMKKLDKLFSSPSQKLPVIQISGNNGKSLTAYFTSKLLQKEGLKVGIFYAPHITTYNERFSINNELISNDAFTALANIVINEAQCAKIAVNTYEVLTQMALNYFVEQNVDVALLESNEGGSSNATALCTPKIVAITRITDKKGATLETASDDILEEYLKVVGKDTHIISADQNKTHLKFMFDWTKKHGGQWAMPIRKLVALEYPFEQLHGRCAALAERIASIFINSCQATDNNEKVATLEDSLIAKKAGQRGRPTLEAKRNAELNPKYTLEEFWKETLNELPGRFELIDKEKPAVLLDVADNIDALENLFLGIRLLNYQRPIKGVALIVGFHKETIHQEEFIKAVRYFFKKTNGIVIFCPLTAQKEWLTESWNVQDIENEMKDTKVKIRSTASFKEAFEVAKKSVNDKQGLIVVTGSSAMVNNYWQLKGVKK
ncbi:hypothetical protein EBU24_05450 [bacterium]|nr:hypothetical protein [bacterium]